MATKRPLMPPKSPQRTRSTGKIPPKVAPKVQRINGGSDFLTVVQPLAGSRVSAASSSSSDSGIESPVSISISPCTQESLDSIFSFDTLAEEFSERISEAWPMKCSYVVKELLQTERIYVNDLGNIIKGYLTPLYSYLLSSGEGPNLLRTVFSNIVKIHHVHMDFLECLQSSCTNTQSFGSAFLNCDFLSVYTVYCTNFSKANDCLEDALLSNPTLKEFIEQCQHEVGHALPLSHQLIKPVQRILKYRLMLEELTKHYDYQNDAHSTLQDALAKMSSVAEKINTAFNSEPKKLQKSTPSLVAKKKAAQIKELQKSRTLPRRISNGDNTNSISAKSYSFAASSTTTRRPDTPGGSPSHHHTSKLSSLPARSMEVPTSTGMMDAAGEEDVKHIRRLPSVSELRNYFENLGHSSRVSKVNRGIQRAASAASLHNTSPKTSPKHSPKHSSPLRRRNSVGKATELSVNNVNYSGFISNGSGIGGGVYAAAISSSNSVHNPKLQAQHISNAGIVANEILRLNGMAK